MIGRTHRRKIVGELTSRKARSLMAILSILIGVFGVTTMISMADLIERHLAEDVRPEAISHTHVYLMNPGERIADNTAYLAQIRQMDGVTDAEGQAVYPVFWQAASSQDDAYQDGYIVAFSEPYGSADLESISRLIEGRYPASGEIAIEQRFADQHGIQVGDALRLQGSDRAWAVVGTVIHAYFTMSPTAQDQIPPQDAIYLNYADAQAELGIPGLSAIHVRYQDKAAATAGLNPLIEQIDRSTPYIPLFTFLDDPEANFITETMEQVNQVFVILGLMAVVVSGFLVTNIMNTILVEQKRQIGIMKAIGASLRDNLIIYTGIALLYGIIGSLFGILLAIPTASLAAQAIAPNAFTYIADFQISGQGIGAGLLLGLLIPIIAAFLPVLKGVRISILEAMTDLGLASGWGLSPVSRLIGRLPLPRMMVQALSNIYQQKGRLMLTGFTLMLAVAAFMSVQATSSILDDFVDNLFVAINYDVVVTLQNMEDADHLSQLIQDEMAAVEAVYPGYSIAVGVENYASTNPFTEGSDQITATGIDPQQPAFRLDTDWQPGGIVVSQSLADNTGKGVGDSLNLTIGETTSAYTIIGIDAYAFDALFIDWRELAGAAGYVDAQGQPAPTMLYVDLRGGREVEAVDRQIAALSDLMEAQGVAATYTNQPQMEANQIQQVGLFGMVFSVAAGILAAVGAVGLMAALWMAVLERQKEIGVMRSVGATSSTIMSQFLMEGLMIGGVSWLIAVPVSVGLSQGLIAILPFDYLDFSYSLQTPVIGLVGMLLVAMAASLLPSLLATRKTVSEILRYQ